MMKDDKNKISWAFNWLDTSLRTKLKVTIVFLLIFITVLGIWIGFSFHWWNASNYITKYTPNPAKVMRDIIWLTGSVVGGSLAILGFVNAIHRTQQKDRELDASRRSIDAGIFAKSVEQLGHEQMSIRLGGLYSLENLARSARALPLDADNQAYLNSLLETLASFVRVSAPIPTNNKQNKDDKIAIDVEVSIRIISRVFTYELRQNIKAKVDFRNCYLPFLEMPEQADMQAFNFMHSILRNARLESVNLSKANFNTADLTKAFLITTNLSNTNLIHVNLHKAVIHLSNLTNSTFSIVGSKYQIMNWDEKQFSTCLWSPNQMPNCLDGDLTDDLQSVIDTRTKVISEGELWETYLVERGKNRNS